MFDETLLDSVLSTERGRRLKRRWVSWASATAVEGLVLGLLVLTPLVNTPALPKTFLSELLFAPVPPPAPAATVSAPHRAPPHLTQQELLSAPVVIPKMIARIVEAPEARPEGAGVVPGAVPGGVQDGVPGGILGAPFLGLVPAPPPPPATRPRPLRTVCELQAAKLVFQPKPEYPPLARLARIQGRVRLEAIIAKDGTIADLKVMSGHPLLAEAALEAVRRWRYQPTLLNGKPVEVETEIEVNFILGE